MYVPDHLSGIGSLDDPNVTERLWSLHAAASIADWGQVVSNGGPPCFHIEDGRFCLRAHHWEGHPVFHKVTTLAGAIMWAQTGEWP